MKYGRTFTLNIGLPALLIVSAVLCIACENGTNTVDQTNDGAAQEDSDAGSRELLRFISGSRVEAADVQALLEQGADVHSRDFNGETALHRAARNTRDGCECVQVVAVLLANGADINAADNGGETPLHRAAQFDNAPVAAALLDGGADMQAVDSWGETPLHLAVRADHTSVVETLLDYGADIDASEDAGASPLAYANLEIARLLLDRGADPNAGVNKPLHRVVWRGDLAVAELLLDGGADINARSHGLTALHIVRDAPDRPAMAKLLLDRGADIEAMDDTGFGPLLAAVSAHQADLVALFLDRGANVLAQHESGTGVLDLALNSSPEVMQVLIQRGVLAAHDIATAADLCQIAGRDAGISAQAALLKEHCDATGVEAEWRLWLEVRKLDGSDVLPEHPWAAKLAEESDELGAVTILRDLEDSHPDAFEIVRQFAFFADGITEHEHQALLLIDYNLQEHGFPAGDPSLLEALSQTWWRLAESISWREVVLPLSISSDAESPDAFLEALRKPLPLENYADAKSCPDLDPQVPLADLPWTQDGLSALEREALTDLEIFEHQLPEMAGYILRYTWVADGITEEEQMALRHLLHITRGSLSPSTLPLRDEIYQYLVDTMCRRSYLMDGISPADLQLLEDVTEPSEQADMLLILFNNEELAEEE